MLTDNQKKIREKVLISEKVDYITKKISKDLKMPFHNDTENN